MEGDENMARYLLKIIYHYSTAFDFMVMAKVIRQQKGLVMEYNKRDKV